MSWSVVQVKGSNGSDVVVDVVVVKKEAVEMESACVLYVIGFRCPLSVLTRAGENAATLRQSLSILLNCGFFPIVTVHSVRSLVHDATQGFSWGGVFINTIVVGSLIDEYTYRLPRQCPAGGNPSIANKHQTTTQTIQRSSVLDMRPATLPP